MAFVIRSERFMGQQPPTEQSEVGLGQYFGCGNSMRPKRKMKKKQIEQIPFNSSSSRDDMLYGRNDNPGPGSYDNPIEIGSSEFPNILGHTKITQKSTSVFPLTTKDHKKIGFLSKETRFTVVKDKSYYPGPGYYEFYNTTATATVNANANAMTLHEKNSTKLLGSTAKAVSIPNKTQAFGYQISQNGVAYPVEDPDKNWKFNGTKDDCVGPGRYNLNNPYQWKKNSIEWKRKSTEAQSLPALLKEFNTSSTTLLSSNDSYQTVRSNDKTASHKDTALQKDKHVIFKQIMKKRKDLHNLKTNNINSLEENKIVNKELPGPGYYFQEQDTNKNQKQFQVNFGSQSERFSNETFSNIGPGQYFRDDSSALFLRKQNLPLKISQPQPKRPKSEDKKERNVKKYDPSLLGPGHYDPKSPGKQSPSNVSQFGALQNRFIKEKKSNEHSPGPGTYLWQEVWAKESPHQVRKRRMPEYEEQKKSLCANEKKSKKHPGVGSYNVDLVNSIRFKISSKTNQYQSAIAPFASMEMRFNSQLEQNNEQRGPGCYYKDSPIEQVQANPAFKSGERRWNYRKPEIDVGPGEYNQLNYYNWKKRSFNNLFI